MCVQSTCNTDPLCLVGHGRLVYSHKIEFARLNLALYARSRGIYIYLIMLLLLLTGGVCSDIPAQAAVCSVGVDL